MVSIRKAVEEDLEMIHRILEMNEQIPDVSLGDIASFIVGEEDGKTVACGMLKDHKNSVEISKVSVLPEYQGRGIGTSITKKLLEITKGRTCWLLSVGSLPFWEKFGFYTVPKREEPIEAREYCQKCKQAERCGRVVMFRDVG